MLTFEVVRAIAWHLRVGGLVDADGVWPAANTVRASMQKRDTLPALKVGSPYLLSVRLAIFDAAFTADCCRASANFYRTVHHVVSRAPGQKSFAVLPALAGTAQNCAIRTVVEGG